MFYNNVLSCPYGLLGVMHVSAPYRYEWRFALVPFPSWRGCEMRNIIRKVSGQFSQHPRRSGGILLGAAAATALVVTAGKVRRNRQRAS